MIAFLIFIIMPKAWHLQSEPNEMIDGKTYFPKSLERLDGNEP
jgi:hypothetical protein